ncbi:MAG: serine/threonine-protein kinase [Deltaproteobacteria bacterium]|nr:serine/threonine-protein kinase [Deltaproteobacteria bacterium]
MTRYQLVRTLASGGMAQVLEGLAIGAEGFERRVAIKRILPEDAADPQKRQMFLQEAHVGSRLHHGGIVQIVDFGTLDGNDFLVMEFVDGIDCKRATRRMHMPEGVALHIVAEVAHALHYIHNVKDEQGQPLGIVHRDVSPQNILLSWDGDVKISDFGIALSTLRREHTATGVVKGKLRYMAPEQARARVVTAAADIYALGATLDFLLGDTFDGDVPFMRPSDSRCADAVARGVSTACAQLMGDMTQIEAGLRPNASDVARRAGTLAAQVLGRDGRSALRQWLEQCRAQEKTSALDDLMGLCLTQLPGGEERAFTVTRHTAVEASSSTRARTVAELSRGRLRVRRRVAAAFAAAVPLVAAAAFAWVSQGSKTQAPSPQQSHGPRVVALPTPAAEPPAAQPRTPPVPASPVALAKPNTARVPRKATEAVTAQGWFAVGGAKFMGGAVSLDGKVVGHAPIQVQAKVGKHVVAVFDATSRKLLLKKPIDIREANTRFVPLRLLSN